MQLLLIRMSDRFIEDPFFSTDKMVFEVAGNSVFPVAVTRMSVLKMSPKMACLTV